MGKFSDNQLYLELTFKNKIQQNYIKLLDNEIEFSSKII